MPSNFPYRPALSQTSLLRCGILSILWHIGMVVFLVKFSTVSMDRLSSESSDQREEISLKNQTLKESLAHFDETSPPQNPKVLLPETEKFSDVFELTVSLPSVLLSSPPFSINTTFLSEYMDIYCAPLNTQVAALFPFFPEELKAISLIPPQRSQNHPKEIAPSLESLIACGELELLQGAPSISLSSSPPFSFPSALFPQIAEPKTVLPPPSPPMPEFPSLSALQTSVYSDMFDVELHLLPQDDQEEILFTLTLIPKKEAYLPIVPNCITFLIDCSNSIQKQRLSLVKHAVYRAIEQLPQHTFFNILAFDHKIQKFSPHFSARNQNTLKQAKRFLDELQIGSFFSTTDLFKPLLSVIPKTKSATELHTVILITDGDALRKKKTQEHFLRQWSYYNQQKVELYTVAIGDHPALNTLETASVISGGKLLFASTKTAIRRKMLKLTRSLASPIATNLHIKSLSKDLSPPLIFHTPSANHLFSSEPLVLFGKASSLDDFILLIQGQGTDQWIHVKKNISFAQAKEGSLALKTHWATQQAYYLYKQYLEEGDESLRQKAELLSQQYDLPLYLP